MPLDSARLTIRTPHQRGASHAEEKDGAPAMQRAALSAAIDALFDLNLAALTAAPATLSSPRTPDAPPRRQSASAMEPPPTPPEANAAATLLAQGDSVSLASPLSLSLSHSEPPSPSLPLSPAEPASPPSPVPPSPSEPSSASTSSPPPSAPPTPAALARRGEAHHAAGEYALASEAFGAAYRLDCRKPSYLFAQGIALIKQGKAEVGEFLCDEAKERGAAGPRDAAEYHRALGEAWTVQEKFAEAEASYRQALLLQPDNPALHGELAAALLGQGKFCDAEAASRAALARDASAARFYRTLGDSLLKQERYDDAASAYREAIRLAPLQSATHGRLGEAMLGLDDAASVQAFREALRLDPDVAAHHCGLGRALLGQGDEQAAETACRRAVELTPGDALHHTHLGRALEALSRFAEAETAHREALRLDSHNAAVCFDLSLALYGQGNLLDAERACRDALALCGDDVAYLQHLGTLLNEQERYVEAEVFLREAVRVAPSSLKTYTLLSETLLEQQKYAQAEDLLDKGLRFDPGDVELRKLLGDALRLCGKHAQADEAYVGVLHADPSHAGARHGLAINAHACGRLDEAVEHFQRGRAAGARFGTLLHDWAATVRQEAVEAAKADRFDLVEDLYQTIVALFPDDDIRVRLGELCAECGKYGKAIDYAKKVLTQEPEHAMALQHLETWRERSLEGQAAEGLDRYKRESYGDALYYFTLAVDASPKDPELLTRLGQSLEKLGRFGEAAERYAQAIEHGAWLDAVEGRRACEARALSAAERQRCEFRLTDAGGWGVEEWAARHMAKKQFKALIADLGHPDAGTERARFLAKAYYGLATVYHREGGKSLLKTRDALQQAKHYCFTSDLRGPIERFFADR